jgi:hypothetical protein
MMGSTRLKQLVEVTKGHSKQTFVKLQNVVVWIVKHCADDDAESLEGRSAEVIAGLESSFEDSFLDAATDKGCSTSWAGAMGAERWAATAEKASSPTTSQTIISRFLLHHLGIDL